MFIKKENLEKEGEIERTLERLNGFCEKFKGTHNFHNYTKKMRATEPQAMRYIMDMKCELVDMGEGGKFFRYLIRG